MRPTSAKHYFLTIFVIGALLFGTFSAVLYRQYSDARRTHEWAMHYFGVLHAINVTLIDLLNMETGVRGYLLTGQHQFLDPYTAALPRIAPELDQLSHMMQDDAPFKLESFFSEVRALQSAMESDIALSAGGAGKVSTETLGTEKAAMDHLRQYVAALTHDGITDLNRQLDASQEKAKAFVALLVIGTVLAIGAMLLATMIMLSLSARSRRAEEEVRKGEERFRMVMDGINDGLFDHDVAHETIYYSPAYKAMLGYGEEEYPDTPEMFRNRVHPEDSATVFETMRRYSERKIAVYTNVFRMRHKDGSWLWILARGIGIWDRNDVMTRLIGTHTDITDQKNREEELRRVNSDLETFTYIVSHDLRSPLVNLKGFASEMELALRQASPAIKKAEALLAESERGQLEAAFERDIPEALQFIKQAVDRMDVLTSAVLDLSRLGKRELHMERVDTHALVERCLSSIAYEIGKKGVEVTCSDLPEVVCDALALEQIFANLIDNAVKYLTPGSKGKIAISAKHAGDHAVFTVRDNGRGIAENDRQKVFEIFRRARNTADARGVGMGLTFVKTTVRKLGGSIWFDSQIGEGTAFHFTLPVRHLYTLTVKEKTA